VKRRKNRCGLNKICVLIKRGILAGRGVIFDDAEAVGALDDL